MPSTQLRKVTVVLPADLIERATRATGEGLTPTLRKGLESVVASKAAEGLRALRGKIKYPSDFETLRHEDR